MQVLITGANGFIGSHLVDHLIKKGYKTRCTVRKTSNLRWLKSKPVELSFVDLRSPAIPSSIFEDVEYIFHVAGVVKAKNPGEFMKGNWLSTKNLIESAVRYCKNLRRFVLISSQAASGPSKTKEPVFEDTPPNPVSVYGVSKLKAEHEVLKFKNAIPVTIIRPPVVYGPRDENLLFYFKIIKSGIGVQLGHEKYISVIYIQDLVEGITTSAFSENARGETFFITDNKPYSQRELLATIALAMKRKIPIITIHDGIIKFMGAFMEDSMKIFNRSHIFNRSKAKEILCRYWICSGQKAKEVLGFETGTPIQQGLSLTIEDYKKDGML
jgi:nucleoside-diphosphate-sugar epimerase